MLGRFSVLAVLVACGPTPDLGRDDAGPVTDSGVEPGDAGSGDAGEADAGGLDAGRPGVVATRQGLVRGARTQDTWSFKGIPYAAPPTGALRWKAPVDPSPWPGVRDALAFGASCPQRVADGGLTGDEDCLTLNVWTPAQAAPAPVLVFVHGGAHYAGASSVPLYDGHALSAHGAVVVVTLNYRLGALGFLAHASLGAENANGASGNYGYLDQTHALKWVQDNIAAFGGDPSRVMLFGQSAGGYGVCMQVASPLARGLFSRAMILSGGCTAMTKPFAEASGASVASRLGCVGNDVPGCLRGKSLGTLLAVPVNDGQTTSVVAGPVIDGWFLPAHPMSRLALNTVPVIVSTTKDEYTNQLGLYGGSRPVSTSAEFEQVVRQMYSTNADAVLARYPLVDYPSPNEALIALLSDSNFTCPARAFTRLLVGPGRSVWRVVFSHTVEQGPARSLRAAHGFDLLFGFRNFLGYSPTAAERRLSDTVAGIWIRLAKNGDAEWPTYESARDNHLVLDEPPSAGEGIRTPYCNFWWP
jgi:para-nitrobenzyl esterase